MLIYIAAPRECMLWGCVGLKFKKTRLSVMAVIAFFKALEVVIALSE